MSAAAIVPTHDAGNPHPKGSRGAFAYTRVYAQAARPRRGACRTAAALALLVALASAPIARADEPGSPNVTSSLRDAVWLTGSGALLGASLAGMFALKADALADRADGLPYGSSELPVLERDASTATRLAIGFGVGATLFAATSLLLLLEPDFFAADSGRHITPVAGPGAAGLCWRGRL